LSTCATRRGREGVSFPLSRPLLEGTACHLAASVTHGQPLTTFSVFLFLCHGNIKVRAAKCADICTPTVVLPRPDLLRFALHFASASQHTAPAPDSRPIRSQRITRPVTFSHIHASPPPSPFSSVWGPTMSGRPVPWCHPSSSPPRLRYTTIDVKRLAPISPDSAAAFTLSFQLSHRIRLPNSLLLPTHM